MREHREQRARNIDPANAKLTVLACSELYRQAIAANVSLKPRTREYYGEVVSALLRSWPALATTEVRRITAPACRDWSIAYANAVSATRYNNTAAVLRHVLDIAVVNGIIYSNPANDLKRRTIRQKVLSLPSRVKFQEFIAEMSRAGGRDSRNCADLAEGLAVTGCRKSEAAELERRDLDFEAGMIVVKGTPEERTKNSEVRRVPMISAARALFDRLLASRPDEAPTAKVFLVNECQKAMDRAAKCIGMERITHHDLRHLFATICIESGVDIPTVSRWLGHKDGGALAMRIYGHLRDEHSVNAARKVSFAPMGAEQAKNVIEFQPATA
ncbi:MAG: site-specific integrase [Acidobacteriota bacterium]|nr:site-specific integrase [Acidobacteriota bacterium]